MAIISATCTARNKRRSSCALTLTELIVVIAILGALATGAVPSVRLLMAHASADSVEAGIQTSWRLAVATAQVGATGGLARLVGQYRAAAGRPRRSGRDALV